jgi:hypothetical protein
VVLDADVVIDALDGSDPTTPRPAGASWAGNDETTLG